MKLNLFLNDQALLSELGNRLAQYRIARSATQDDLARRAGLGKRTLERLENGGSVQLSSFIRILRELDLLDALDSLIPEPGPRPMDLLKLGGKTRQRASRLRKDQAKPWSWNEE